jgi:hypothetical protein
MVFEASEIQNHVLSDLCEQITDQGIALAPRCGLLLLVNE